MRRVSLCRWQPFRTSVSMMNRRFLPHPSWSVLPAAHRGRRTREVPMGVFRLRVSSRSTDGRREAFGGATRHLAASPGPHRPAVRTDKLGRWVQDGFVDGSRVPGRGVGYWRDVQPAAGSLDVATTGQVGREGIDVLGDRRGPHALSSRRRASRPTSPGSGWRSCVAGGRCRRPPVVTGADEHGLSGFQVSSTRPCLKAGLGFVPRASRSGPV